MKNLKDSISINICTTGAKVPTAIYIRVHGQIVCLEENFQKGMSLSKTYILNNVLDLKQLKIEII